MIQQASITQRAVVVYPEGPESAQAVEALLASGFAASQVQLLAEEDDPEGDSIDFEMVDPGDHKPGRHTLLFTLVGGLVIGAATLVTGLGAWSIDGPGADTNIDWPVVVAAMTAAGAVLGLFTGFLVGGVADLDTPEDLDKNLYRTILRSGGSVLVVSGSPSQLARVGRILGKSRESVRIYPNNGTQGEEPNPTS